MRKIEKISKKHKILKELSEQSDLFRILARMSEKCVRSEITKPSEKAHGFNRWMKA